MCVLLAIRDVVAKASGATALFSSFWLAVFIGARESLVILVVNDVVSFCLADVEEDRVTDEECDDDADAEDDSDADDSFLR